MTITRNPEEEYKGKFLETIPNFPLRNWITTTGMGDFSLDQENEEGENQLRRIMAITGMNNVHRLVPQHGSEYSIADENMGMIYHASDAVISTPKGKPKLLASPTGDCPIILLTDQDNNFGALLHAGWRSLKGNIIANVLSPLKGIISPEKMIVGLFPGICVNCFKVAPGFDDGDGQFDHRISRGQLNLKSIILDQLKEEGILENNIYKYEYCSFHSREDDKQQNRLKFFSHRRGDIQRNLACMIA